MQKIKIVCLGDSITYGYNLVGGKETQAPNNYPLYLENKLKKHYEEVEVINSGMPGWQVKQANLYLDELVIKHKPDICFIMYGINDMIGSPRGGLRLSEKSYFRKLNEIILKLQLKNIEVVLLTPICIENERVTKLSNNIINFAKDKNINFVDINKITRLEIAKSTENIKDVIADSIHFRDDWYYIIGEILFREYFRLENEK